MKMKYLITEKKYNLVIFIEAHNLNLICRIADLIEDTFPDSVIEVTHNRKAKQGSIIVKKGDADFIEKIKELL